MRGMIKGYGYHPDGTLELISCLDDALRLHNVDGVNVWVDLEGESHETLLYAADLFGINPDAIDDALEEDQRPRVDDYGPHHFILLYAMLAPEEPPKFSPRTLGVFLGRGFLLTIHELPIRAIISAHLRAVRNPERAFARGMDYHLFHIMDALVDNCLICAESYEDELDELDEMSMKADAKSGVLTELLQLQRTLIRMRRLVSAQREMAAQFAGGDFEHISDGVEPRFEHIYQHLTHAVELLEGMRETLHGIRDNYYAVLTERTNSLMRTLTIFSAFILPLTLITGFYGMNLSFWPPSEASYAMPIVGAAMLLTAGCMFLYFRRRRWL